MYKHIRQFIKINYNPKLLLGAIAFNTSLSIYCDKKYGKTIYQSSPIVEGCIDSSHVFYGSSRITKYETDLEKIIFGVIPSSILFGLTSIPINVYFNYNEIKNNDFMEQNLENSGCLCGAIKG
jgi:hypothetical protein